MTSTSSGLDLTQDGDDFVMTVSDPSGQTIRVRLTAEQVLRLAQSVPLFRDQALAKFHPTGGGASAVFVTPVGQIELNQDLLGENILLTMIAPDGASQTFALPSQVAEQLGQRLPVRLAEMLKSQPKKQ
jgi:hypothetical protein